MITTCSTRPPEEWAWGAFGGAPYLWGGITSGGIDCSGLVQMTFILRGVPLPRDSREQARHGQVIEPGKQRPGDLLFFRGTDHETIDHVAFFAAADTLIHSTIETGGVTREPWDAIRFLSNRSSGRMGFAVAQAGRDLGYACPLANGVPLSSFTHSSQ